MEKNNVVYHDYACVQDGGEASRQTVAVIRANLWLQNAEFSGLGAHPLHWKVVPS